MPNQIISFYQFCSIKNLEVTKEQLDAFCLEHQLKGLIILAREGLNGTLAGKTQAVESFKKNMFKVLALPQPIFKNSQAVKNPFRRFKIKIRNEIVTLNKNIKPQGSHRHLSPEQWQKTLEEENTVILDTRNQYEVEIGQFKNAISPETRNFQEFPEYLKKNEIAKDQKILIYCTGGIRCEKAILEMENQGYKNVYQLEGGILKYLEKHPDKNFKGECFVFDHRVSVDQNLNPSQKYYLCIHCGDPTDKKENCIQCNKKEFVCSFCFKQDNSYQTCSKNCRHHFLLGHKTTRPHKDSQKKRIRCHS